MIAVYYDATGLITKTVTGTKETIALNIGEGETLLMVPASTDIEGSYVKNGAITPKTEMNVTYPATVAINTKAVITGIPVTTQVTWPDGEQTDEAGGSVSFEAPVTGAYTFSLLHPHHFEKEVTIDVTP